jgi:hypothetical protein
VDADPELEAYTGETVVRLPRVWTAAARTLAATIGEVAL